MYYICVHPFVFINRFYFRHSTENITIFINYSNIHYKLKGLLIFHLILFLPYIKTRLYSCWTLMIYFIHTVKETVNNSLYIVKVYIPLHKTMLKRPLIKPLYIVPYIKIMWQETRRLRRRIFIRSITSIYV